MKLYITNEPKKDYKKIKKEIKKCDKKSRDIRVLRTLNFYSELNYIYVFSDDRIIRETFEELTDSYVQGHYISVINLSQLLLEQYLKSLLEKEGNVQDAKINYSSLLDSAKRNGIIDKVKFDRLTELSFIRNSYTHPKSFRAKKGFYKAMKEHADDCLKIISEIINP